MVTLVVQNVKPVEAPLQRDTPRFGIGLELVEADRLVKASKARTDFGVSGSGLTVAVLDTGLRTTHVDFAGRVKAQRNFTADNSADVDDANDGNGHGTNVTGIIAAGDNHIGIAPGVEIAALKVLSNAGGGSFMAIHDALAWVMDNQEALNIASVCMSLGDGGNYTDEAPFANDDTAKLINELTRQRVAVHIAAGNDYFVHSSAEGMGFPAIIGKCISVGAVYDEDEGSFSYNSGAVANSTAPDRLTPFSQRLHETTSTSSHTDVFAPGAPITSSGIQSDTGESVQHGTSQATPVTAGVSLLLQELHLRATGELPTVENLIDWIRRSGQEIFDGDDEDDNVSNTNKTFRRVNAVSALSLMKRDLEVASLTSANCGLKS